MILLYFCCILGVLRNGFCRFHYWYIKLVFKLQSSFFFFVFLFPGGVLEVSFQLLRLCVGNRLGSIYKINLMLVQICCRERERRLGGGEGNDSGDLCGRLLDQCFL